MGEMNEEQFTEIAEELGIDLLEIEWDYSRVSREVQIFLETHTEHVEALEVLQAAHLRVIGEDHGTEGGTIHDRFANFLFAFSGLQTVSGAETRSK